MTIRKPVTAIAGPSLALIKYWGKAESTQPNIPSTTNIAVTLDILQSTVGISPSERNANSFFLDGKAQPFSNVEILLQALGVTTDKEPITVQAENNFPTAAGLASSASGYAALAQALTVYFSIPTTRKQLSNLARIGSGSACRSVFSGFTIWKQHSLYAEPLASIDHWKDFRIIVVAPYLNKKTISSRQAMLRTAANSPYYAQWRNHNNTLAKDAARAILAKDIEKLGTLCRQSYSAMHASAWAAEPPILYLKPASIAIIEFVETLRAQGIPVWETMDAGPQVKLITLKNYAQNIIDLLLEALLPTYQNLWIRLCKVGEASKIIETSKSERPANSKKGQ